MYQPTTLIHQKYKIIRQIGQGGFGKTYLAENIAESNSPRCVIKIFTPQDSNHSEAALRLFVLESNRLKEVGAHPQIPSFLDFFEQEGQFFLVQDYIEGQNLEEELRQSGALSPEAIKHLLSELLPVLTYIHQHQLIHRDIKPENIVRRARDGQLFLVDFGAAKAVSETVFAKTGTMIGSAGYVSPEQAYGKTVYASDVYSLGVTCIHLLTDLPPFELIDYGDWGWQWQDGLPPATHVSEEFSLLLGQMIERGLSKRFKSASEVELQISQLTQCVSLAKPRKPFVAKVQQRLRRRSHSRGKLAIALGLCFAFILVGRLALKAHNRDLKEAVAHWSTSLSNLIELKEKYEEEKERHEQAKAYKW
jgi:serine/threonine protein kinase